MQKMPAATSPLAPSSFPEMPPIAGVRLATGAAGIRYAGRTDVLLALFDAGTAVAGVLTRSKCPSAPVDWCRARLKGGAASALVVNSGNANAFTGKSGRVATKLTAEIAAKAAHCKTGEVFLASTGVIGEPLDATKFAAVIDRLTADAAPGGWREAAQAIMTTDTFAKGAAAVVRMGSSAVTICGIAKGAGMIAPDMATMLSFVFTDAPIAPAVLKALLRDGVGDTFNAVTIDGDTSPSKWRATAKARASSSRSWSRARCRRNPPASSRYRSPIRRWLRPRSPARTLIGAAWSWRWARPANLPTAISFRSGSTASASPIRANGTRAMTKPPSPPR